VDKDDEVVRSATRSERRPRDMVISLLVLLVPIALFLVIYCTVLGGDDPVTIDTSPAVEAAQAAKAFPVALPAGLDTGWKTVSAAFGDVAGGKALRLGYVSPDGDGVQLAETNAPAESFLPGELTAAAHPEGTVQIDGTAWQRYTTRPGERALVLLEPTRTTIVVGTASEDELRRLAAALP
jgi:hypothetical protein